MLRKGGGGDNLFLLRIACETIISVHGEFIII